MEARRSRRKLVSEINVVPFVDVMLVLVVIFMVTSPVVTQGVNVDLPQADAEPVEDNDEITLVVSIDAAGDYFISLGEVDVENPEAINLAKVTEDVGKIMNQNPSVPVFLEADASVEYGSVMNLWAALIDAGAPNVLLITQPPQ